MPHLTLYRSLLGHNFPLARGNRQLHFTGSNLPVNSMVRVRKLAIPSGTGIPSESSIADADQNCLPSAVTLQ